MPDLLAIHTDFVRDVDRCRSVFVDALANRPAATGTALDIQKFAGWHGLIELHAAWARFCKDVITFSAIGGIHTRTGTLLVHSSVVPVNVPVGDFLSSNWPKNGFGRCFDEGPRWHEPGIADKAADILRIANYQNFSAAILAQNTAISELQGCRNYLAHRTPGTESHTSIALLRQRLNPSTTAPTEDLALELVLGGGTLFEEWCRELEQIATAATR